MWQAVGKWDLLVTFHELTLKKDGISSHKVSSYHLNLFTATTARGNKEEINSLTRLYAMDSLEMWCGL
jgi:hypothetical protein